MARLALANGRDITTDANEAIAPLHDRMPVILLEEDWPAWLGEVSASEDELKGMVRPMAPDRLRMWPVDRRLGNVKNEGAELTAPVAL